jgi:hypothetical protein
MQVTGAAADEAVTKLTLSSLKILKSHANLEPEESALANSTPEKQDGPVPISHPQLCREMRSA